MYARAQYKLDIDDKVIQAGRFDKKSTVEEREDLLVSIFQISTLYLFLYIYFFFPRWRTILEVDQEEKIEEAGGMNDDSHWHCSGLHSGLTYWSGYWAIY